MALDRLANRLEAMAVHHEQQFASAVDNIGDIEVTYIPYSSSLSCFVVVIVIVVILGSVAY